MIKLELMDAYGNAVGRVELDPQHITKVERGSYGARDRIEFAAGWFLVDLDAAQLRAIYLVLAENLEKEAKEADRVISTIR